jgi:hypothetical protein
MAKAICTAFQGDSQAGLAQLDRAARQPGNARIDVLLAQKYAGAAGKARQAVTIQWDETTPACVTPGWPRPSRCWG